MVAEKFGEAFRKNPIDKNPLDTPPPTCCRPDVFATKND